MQLPIRRSHRKISSEFEHLFWMFTLSAASALWSGNVWLIPLILGVELMSINLHSGTHHTQDGWLRHDTWGWIGLTVWAASSYGIIMRGFPVPSYYLTLICSQLFSLSAHRLEHSKISEPIEGHPLLLSAIATVLSSSF